MDLTPAESQRELMDAVDDLRDAENALEEMPAGRDRELMRDLMRDAVARLRAVANGLAEAMVLNAGMA